MLSRPESPFEAWLMLAYGANGKPSPSVRHYGERMSVTRHTDSMRKKLERTSTRRVEARRTPFSVPPIDAMRLR